MLLTIYGDFTCPFSALASERAARLEVVGAATVEWRAVQHLPDLPIESQPIEGDAARQLRDELEQVRSMLRRGESFPIRLPGVLPNTELASGALASAGHGARSGLRSRLLRAYWFDGHDIGDPDVLAQLGVVAVADRPEAVTRWQAQWAAMDGRLVPMMSLPDGHVSRGLGLLTRLADLLDDAGETPGARGG